MNENTAFGDAKLQIELKPHTAVESDSAVTGNG